MDHYKAVHPVKYYQDYLAHKVRPDGRELKTFRQISLNIESFGTADGSATVTVGHTRVVCGIKLELGTPKAEEPDKGYVLINAELSPLCSQEFKPGPPSDKAQVLTAFLNNVVSSSGIVDLKEFCISSDKLVWVLYCDIVCLDYDGAIKDACFLALISALHSVTLPKVEYDEKTGDIQVDDSIRKAISILCKPVSSTFAIFDDDTILTDPCNEEELLSSGLMTIITDGEKLYSVFKPGGATLNDSRVQECIQAAKARALIIKELIQTVLMVS